MATRYKKSEVIAKICSPDFNLNSGEDTSPLTRGYIDCAKGTGFVGKYLYGVNVRTSDDLEKVNPFFTSSHPNNKTPLRVRDDKVLPKFTDEFGIREMFFYSHIDNNSKPEDIVIVTLVLDGGKLEDDEIIIHSEANKKPRRIPIEDLKKWLLEDVGLGYGNFFSANVSKIGIKSSVAYMWITSEDYYTGEEYEYASHFSKSIYKKRNGQALSNILAISDDKDFLVNHIMSRRTDLLDLLFLLKARNLYDKNVQRLKASVKSAKAAIMSRNMSHNLGSHVMAYLKQHLYSVQDMIKDNVLDQILSPSDMSMLTKLLSPEMPVASVQTEVNKWLENIKEKVKENENNGDNVQEIALPFLVGLGKFISYLQERQDFIATIATDYNPYFASVNFKDFIYDELNPDLRYERHKDRSGMRPDNILLGNIAKSEGLARVTRPTKDKENEMSDIIIKFRSFDGRLVEKGSIEDRNLGEMRKIDISLPGGVVGRQAIFSIFENIIRNAAKHGKWGEGKENLVLTIDYYDRPSTFMSAPKEKPLQYYVNENSNANWRKIIEPNSYEFLEKYYSAASDNCEVSVFTITDNMWFETVVSDQSIDKYYKKYNGNGQIWEPLSKELYQRSQASNLLRFRKAILQNYVDSEGRMINENKGIKEMRISAAWLRSLEDDPRYNPLNPELKQNKTFFKDGKWQGIAPILMARPVYAGTTSSSISVNGKKYPIMLDNYNLQIIFCLMKPKKVAIVTDQGNLDNALLDLLKEYGWGAFTSEQFVNPSNKNRSYAFVIVDDVNKRRPVSYDEIRKVSHNRTFKLSSLAADINSDIEAILSSNVDSLSDLVGQMDRVEMNLYKYLSDVDKHPATIRISDDKTMPDNKTSKLVSIVNGSSKEGGKFCKFIYRKHFEMDNQFNGFMKMSPLCDFFDDTKYFPNDCVSFVEGITGNNSTDRLVRNEELNDRWAYSHLHAMKQKIAIFDERIFSKIYAKDETDIKSNAQAMGKVSKARRKLANDMVDYRELRKQYGENLSPQAIMRITDIKDKIEKINLFNKYLTDCYNREQKFIPMDSDRMAIANALKGVFVFTIININHNLRVYGYCGQKRIGDKWYSKLGEVGSVSLSKDGCVEFVIDEDFQNKFDYISIHQGLLDKIYEALNIKNIESKKELEKKKLEVTNVIYKCLSKEKGTDIIGDFLPRLMIHSGRSKPSSADMPQPQPFIQYAAIEHAVLDCKFSLVELMDYARYEQYED